MDSAKLIKNFEKHGFTVKLFETRKEACDYLKETLKGEVVGFGGSMTTQELGLYELLGEQNEYGIVVENSEDGIYEGMKKMLSEPETLAHYKEKAAERGHYFSKEKTVKAVEEMLDEL